MPVDPGVGVLERIVTDLRAEGISDHEVRQASERFLAQADRSIRGPV